MTTYTHPFPLKSYERVRTFVQSYMGQYNEGRLIVKTISLPNALLAEINSELAEYGVPPVILTIVFKRKEFNIPRTDKVHIDLLDNKLRSECHTSLIIPISGCENSYMYWYDGKRTKEKQVISKIAGEYNYHFATWDEEPVMVHKEEITEPTLCRVDIPHSVCSPSEDYRTIISFRFQGNPTFDEIVQKRFDNNSIV